MGIIIKIANGEERDNVIRFASENFKADDIQTLKKLKLEKTAYEYELRLLVGDYSAEKGPKPEMFGAYVDGKLRGSIGFFNNTQPIKRIFRTKYPACFREVTKMTSYPPSQRLTSYVFKGLALTFSLFAEADPNMIDYLGSVKPRTLKCLRYILGKKSFDEIEYDGIIEENVPLDSRVFYLYPDKPVIFRTNREMIREGRKKLQASLKGLIDFQLHLPGT